MTTSRAKPDIMRETGDGRTKPSDPALDLPSDLPSDPPSECSSRSPGSAPLIRPAKLAHFVLKTARYREMIDWYETVLGMEIAHGNSTATFLSYDDEHHRLGIIRSLGLLPNWRGAAGVDHVAFTYTSIGALLSTYERLKGLGIEPVWPINHGATLSFYYKDPDSNVVELQVDVFGSRAETAAFLADGRFAINPIGIDVDPEDLLSRFRDGASHEELTRWPEEVEPRRTPPPTAYLGWLQAFVLKLVFILQRRRV